MATIKTVEQIPACNVLKALLDGEVVYGIDTVNERLFNLTNYTINRIRGNIKKSEYLYILVKGGVDDNEAGSSQDGGISEL